MNDNVLSIDTSGLRDWLVRYIGSVLEMPEGEFPTAENFDTYGLDSSETVIMAGVMEEEFGIQIDPVTLFENPSVDQLVSVFLERGLIRA
jgi:acyl carrier protein